MTTKDWIGLAYVGGVGSAIAYCLWSGRKAVALVTRKEEEGRTAAPVPSKVTSKSREDYPDMSAVQKRIGEVLDLYRMNYITPEDARRQLEILNIMAHDVHDRGLVTFSELEKIRNEILRIDADIKDFLLHRRANPPVATVPAGT